MSASKELRIKIKGNSVIFEGSIEAEHVFPFATHRIDIKLSDGTELRFKHETRCDIWVVSHNKSRADRPKLYEFHSTNEYGTSDEFYIKYEVSNGVVIIENESTFYGIPVLSTEQSAHYEKLLVYLKKKGFVCLEELKTDLKLILTGLTPPM